MIGRKAARLPDDGIGVAQLLQVPSCGICGRTGVSGCSTAQPLQPPSAPAGCVSEARAITIKSAKVLMAFLCSTNRA